MSCEYCEMVLDDEDDDGYRSMVGKSSIATDDDDVKITVGEITFDGCTDGSLTVHVNLEWDESVNWRVGRENGVLKIPTGISETFIVFDVNYCPMCGRKLGDAE